MKAIFLVLASTDENESTDQCTKFKYCIAGTNSGFRGEGGGKDTGVRLPPPARISGYGPSGSGAEPQPLCTFKVTKTA